MSFLDRISPFFPELSALSETQPINYSTAQDALVEFNTIQREIGYIYHDFRSAVLSQTEKDYKSQLDVQMQILKTRLKSIEKEYSKHIKKIIKEILNETAENKFADPSKLRGKENINNTNQ